MFSLARDWVKGMSTVDTTQDHGDARDDSGVRMA